LHPDITQILSGFGLGFNMGISESNSKPISIQRIQFLTHPAELGKLLNWIIRQLKLSVGKLCNLGLVGIRLSSCSPKERRFTDVDGLHNEIADAVAGRHRGE
jgi:hypothetical protein